MRFSALFIATAFLLPVALTSPSRTVVGYYADWTSAKLPADQIPYNKLTHINYAFAIVDESFKISFTTQSLLSQVVSNAHSAGTKVLLSIGGWTGSRYFSPLSMSDSARTDFISQATSLVDQYSLDGIDIDWEFPGRLGLECNAFDPAHDSGNFLLLLTGLRNALNKRYGGNRKEISLAVRIAPFDGPNGPLDNVADFAAVVDRINLMAYDINGGWSKTAGANAPFHGGPETLVGAGQAWVKAGMPANKIAAGLAFYGRAVTTTQAPAGNASPIGLPISSTVPQGDSEDAPWADPCPGSAAVMSGVWQWRNLRAQQALTTVNSAGPGWTNGWDSASQTPWLYRASDNTFVSYDDPKSLQIKVNWARCNGMAGVMIWDLHNDNGELLNAVVGENGECA